MHLQIVYNMEASKVILSELNIRLHFILRFVDEFLTDLTKHIAAMLDMTINEAEVYYNVFVDNISSIKLYMPNGDEITGDQIWELFNYAYYDIIGFVLYLLELYGEISENVVGALRQVSEMAKPYIKVSEGRLEINLAFPFQH